MLSPAERPPPGDAAAVVRRNYQRWLAFIDQTDRSLPPPRGLRAPREKCAVIIEPRPHPHLSYVARNVLHFLDDSWGLCVVHGTENRSFVEQMVAGWGEVVLLDCGAADLPGYRYADFKCSRRFWEQVPAETVLMFETDSILRRPGIDEFLEYDYVGAPWFWAVLNTDRAEGPVGNGGLSLRKRSAMLRILEGHAHEPGTSEDQFFSRWLYRDGHRLPSLRTAGLFSTETIFQPRSLGLHKAWQFCFEEAFEQLLATVRY
jgi:hypothetical protein